MTRLDSFKNNDIKNLNALSAAMRSLDLITDEVEPASVRKAKKAAKTEPAKTEPTLRSQMLRWYNANSDMFFIAITNLLRITEEVKKEESLFVWAVEYRSSQGTLSTNAENAKVSDITLVEDFLFVVYPVMESFAALTRPSDAVVKHLITENIEKATIFDLCNALVEESRKKDSPARLNYVDLLDVLTC